MATKKKMLQAAAGNAGGEPGLDITEVFSTYLYEGTATNVSHQIQNGIDLAGEGGLVWIKKRDSNIANTNHYLSDTERGNFYLASNSTNAQAAGDIASYNSDGWTFNASTGLGTDYLAAQSYASWTFRKAPKFFDVVTYTGNDNSGSSEQTITHNLDGTVGSIFIKKTTGTHNWWVWHRSLSATTNGLYLNATNSEVTGPTGTNYYVKDVTDTSFKVGGQGTVNGLGETYVAYVFAHNDGDGEFGPDGGQDIIKCGSFTGNGSSTGPVIDLGFEPQWLLVKNASIYSNANWYILDVMRGWDVGGTGSGTLNLRANLTDAEQAMGLIDPNSTGFQVKTSGSFINGSGHKIIYMAIRRGPLAQPESGTEVFAVKRHAGADGPQPAGITSDMLITTNSEVASTQRFNFNRLTNGKVLYTGENYAEANYSPYLNFGTNNGVNTTGFWGNTSVPLYYHWKRAPGFCDVVAYTGAGANTVINHNLDAIPEMVWVKNRGRAVNWNVYHKDLENNADPASECRLFLNTDSSVSSGAVFWGTHTDTTFTMTAQNFQTNYPNDTYIAYLFATLPGVSKVGSYTGNGTSQTIGCGFTSGARFILIKRTDITGDWYVWDTERGIVAGNDPYLELNTTDAEVTSTDWVDPDNSGFIVNGTTINASSAEYIFYAIA